ARLGARVEGAPAREHDMGGRGLESGGAVGAAPPAGAAARAAATRPAGRIFANFASLDLAEVAAKLLGIGLTVYVTRSFGASAFGQLAFATALASYFALVPDFGLNTLGVREIARDRTRTSTYGTSIV